MAESVSSLVETLRDRSAGDRIQVTTEYRGTFSVVITGSVEYEQPDKYGAGYLRVNCDLDTDEHDVPDEYPTEVATIQAMTTAGSTVFERPKMEIWDPEVADDDESVIVGDDWIECGTVRAICVLS